MRYLSSSVNQRDHAVSLRGGDPRTGQPVAGATRIQCNLFDAEDTGAHRPDHGRSFGGLRGL